MGPTRVCMRCSSGHAPRSVRAWMSMQVIMRAGAEMGRSVGWRGGAVVAPVAPF